MEYAYFQLAIKVLLRKEDEILVLKTNDGYLDFPGGRIDKSEMELPHADIVKREIAEELGQDLAVKIGKLAFVSRRHYNFNDKDHYVLAVYYEADYISGEVELSDEHSHYSWQKPSELLADGTKFMSPDEEVQLKEYFKS